MQIMTKISREILPVLLGTGCVLLYSALAETDWKEFPLFLVSAFLIMAVHLIWRYRKERPMQVLLMVAVAIGIGLFLREYLGGEERRADLWELLLSWKAYYPVLLVIPISFLPKGFWSRIGAAVIVLAAMIVIALKEWTGSGLPVLLLLLYLLSILAEWSARITYRKRGFVSERYEQLVGCLFPILVCMALFLGTLHTPEKPMEWRLVKEAWHTIQEVGRNLSSRVSGFLASDEAEFAIGFGGYEEVANLTGDVRSSKREDLRINGRQKLNKVVYLAGNYKNTYLGNGWSDTAEPLSYNDTWTDGQLDTAELLYAMDRDGMKFSHLVRNRQIMLTYTGLETVTLFQPALSWQIMPEKVKGKEFFYEDNRSGLQWLEEPKYNYRYSLRYLDVNLGSEEFQEFVKRQETYAYENVVIRNYEDIERRWGKWLGNQTLEVTENLELVLMERAEKIRREYLPLPEGLPERVYQLAEEITSEAESDYEKLLAIESYLREYAYTFKPGATPAGSDAVDWFLFEAKKGYCTHFASAAAVLARCVGIPSRYVQGYAVDMRGTHMEADYSIYGNEAHAWAECYLEGVGWIPLEAVASFRGPRYQYWTVLDEVVSESAITVSGTGIAVDGVQIEEEITDVSEKAEVEQNLITEEKRGQLYVLIVIVGILILIAIIVGVYFLLQFLSYWNRYRQTNEMGRIRMDMDQILYMLAQEGYRKEPGETLNQYLVRLKTDWEGDTEALEQILQCYQVYRYGEERMALVDQKQLRAFRNEMVKRIRKKMDPIRFLIFYVWMILR